jgi:hypothetical protein
VLVDLGKMKPSDSEYACKVTLPIKKDGSMRFCGDYRPLNLQTWRDSFPMLLVDDIISQLGKSAWFTTLDLQSGFWQIRMAPEDRKKTALITKTGLYDWTVMPFATLALGLRPRQRGCKGAGQREAQESHQGLPGV